MKEPDLRVHASVWGRHAGAASRSAWRADEEIDWDDEDQDEDEADDDEDEDEEDGTWHDDDTETWQVSGN